MMFPIVSRRKASKKSAPDVAIDVFPQTNGPIAARWTAARRLPCSRSDERLPFGTHQPTRPKRNVENSPGEKGAQKGAKRCLKVFLSKSQKAGGCFMWFIDRNGWMLRPFKDFLLV